MSSVFETLRRTLVKSLTYRVIHYLIHLGEVYIGIYLYSEFGHYGPVFAVASMQCVCWLHYIIHERIFARIKWGYRNESR